ncbi:hypothetical protein TNCV_1265291 [Trichonephila clavipes]|nr:hypothetical protein TNCV_1265291 [Trichonephila clavipes]
MSTVKYIIANECDLKIGNLNNGHLMAILLCCNSCSGAASTVERRLSNVYYPERQIFGLVFLSTTCAVYEYVFEQCRYSLEENAWNKLWSDLEEFDPVDDETDEDENNNNNESSKGPSNADAFSALEQLWSGTNNNQNAVYSTTTVEEEVRDLLERKTNGYNGAAKNK